MYAIQVRVAAIAVGKLVPTSRRNDKTTQINPITVKICATMITGYSQVSRCLFCSQWYLGSLYSESINHLSK